mgnify:CR=1 FL=1
MKKIYETFCEAVAYILPRKVCSFVLVRVFAETSTGIFGQTIAPELTLFDAHKRWEDAS